jgi:hypothetical protein
MWIRFNTVVVILALLTAMSTKNTKIADKTTRYDQPQYVLYIIVNTQS